MFPDTFLVQTDDSWYASLVCHHCLPFTELTKVSAFSVQREASVFVETEGKAKQCLVLTEVNLLVHKAESLHCELKELKK